MSNNLTVVSIVIVSWNARDYLLQCLESLTPAVCRYPMEIIVVDNASSDGSAELVENNFPQARLIRNPANLGFAKANNLGIAAGTGRYVCLINSDVKVLPDCISRLVDYCEQNSDVGMVGSANHRWRRQIAAFLPRVSNFVEYALSRTGIGFNFSENKIIYGLFAFILVAG